MRFCCFAILVCFTGALAVGLAGQAGQSPQTATAATITTSTPARDPQALRLLNQALAHLQSVPEPVLDVTLTATAAYTAGSDHETGTATLEAAAGGSAVSVPWDMSRVILSLDGGRREEVRNGFAGGWVGKDGAAHAAALHNCWTGASWFAPLLTLEAASSDPAISVTLAESSPVIPANTESSHSRESGNPELVLSRILPNQSAAMTAEIQKLSTMSLYLDASTFLPVELDFNLHPDQDAGRDIPVEIHFSDYHPVSGVLIPFHIQKYIQDSLLLDLEVSTVAVNSGLPASDFAIPAAAGAPLAAPATAPEGEP